MYRVRAGRSHFLVTLPVLVTALMCERAADAPGCDNSRAGRGATASEREPITFASLGLCAQILFGPPSAPWVSISERQSSCYSRVICL